MGCKGSWVRIPLARSAESCGLSTAWLVLFTGFEPTTPSGSDAVEHRPCCRAGTSARETAQRAAGTGRIPLARSAESCGLSTAWLVLFTGFEPTTPSGSDAVEHRPCCRAETSARETELLREYGGTSEFKPLGCKGKYIFTTLFANYRYSVSRCEDKLYISFRIRCPEKNIATHYFPTKVCFREIQILERFTFPKKERYIL